MLISSLSACLLAWTSLTSIIWSIREFRSKVRFFIYQGALVICRKILFCKSCIIFRSDGLEQPQGGIQYSLWIFLYINCLRLLVYFNRYFCFFFNPRIISLVFCLPIYDVPTLNFWVGMSLGNMGLHRKTLTTVGKLSENRCFDLYCKPSPQTLLKVRCYWLKKLDC